MAGLVSKDWTLKAPWHAAWISLELMRFSNRNQAAELLAQKLARYRKDRPLVLGVPRGSVPMAKIVADRLEGDLDIVLVHKIGAPGNSEFAIGSVSEIGTIYASPYVEASKISPADLKTMADEEIKKLKQRRKVYSPMRPRPIICTDRVVIIIDDGIATGATLLAAVRAIRAQKPKKIVVAAPVSSADAAEWVGREADELDVLDIPPDFFSVSRFYEDFPQVTDEEVIQTLS
ncbi:phosphoribosyltransferase family protein [Bdellovibrionota bacterium FG-1]